MEVTKFRLPPTRVPVRKYQMHSTVGLITLSKLRNTMGRSACNRKKRQIVYIPPSQLRNQKHASQPVHACYVTLQQTQSSKLTKLVSGGFTITQCTGARTPEIALKQDNNF